MSRISVLWFLLILMLSVYMWGYFRPAYIRRSNVSVLVGSGRYSFITVRYATTILDSLKATADRLGWIGTPDLIHFCYYYDLASGFGAKLRCPEAVVPGMHGAHYEPNTVDLHQFSINLTRFIHMWMYVYRKYIPRHMDQMNNKNVTTQQ